MEILHTLPFAWCDVIVYFRLYFAFDILVLFEIL